MNAHALQALEFDRIRELLAGRAASEPGRERAGLLAPLPSLPQARELLETVAELLALRLQENSWPEVRFADLRPVLEKVGIEGAVLEAQELMDVAACLRMASQVTGFFRSSERRQERPHLAQLAAPLLIERDFPRRVARSFEPSGDLRDEASPTLRALRAQLRGRRQAVSQKLEGLSRELPGSTEESFVTLRGGRYVLSVAASERRRLKGIVHDRSATGKTLFMEPLEVVEQNNALAELEADERLEVHRILRELTGWVRQQAPALGATQEGLAAFDELNARCRLAEDLGATLPDLDSAARSLRIVKGRHPLLHLAPEKDVVALELTLGVDTKAFVISGPNMGGKTVLLKTVGLLVLMAMAGLFVPAADGTVVPWVDDIFVDIGDEQSLDFDLSTYAGHLRNMEAILTRASARSLALIDELGAGTDPDEGAALGLALLEEIGRRGSLCITTTHLSAFKVFAAEEPAFANAAMEHDPETLAPTYRMLVGLPGRSHAFELAKREGWPAAVLDRAGGRLSGERLRTEGLLAQIQRERDKLRDERNAVQRETAAVAEAREEAQRLSRELEEKLLSLRRERVLEEDRRLGEMRRMLRELKERIAKVEAPEEGVDAAALRRWVHEQERRAATLRKTQERPLGRSPRETGRQLALRELTPGRSAYSQSLGVDVVLGECEQGGERIWVLHKGLRVLVPVDDLAALAEDESSRSDVTPVLLRSSGAAATRAAQAETVSGELDLRGLDRETCLARLDHYLDRAVLAGLTRLRIIHGKGTGVLRRAVGEFLSSYPHVEAFRDGEAAEGGWGVTMAFLKTPRGPAAKASRGQEET
jgi:DNA mismatch repair protein MutS2